MSVQCIADFFDKAVGRFIYSQSGTDTTGIEKNSDKEPPAIMFFCSVGHLIQSGHMESCLADQKSFLLFKGPRSFNFFF